MQPQPPMYSTIVTYTCGCVSTPPRHVVPPAICDEAYCMYHRRCVLVAQCVDEWVTRCRRCNRNRYHYYGAAKVTALTRASAHAVRTGHSVEIWRGGELVETTGPDVPGQIPLMLF